MTRTDATPHAAATSAAVGEHLLLDLYGVAPALLRDAQALESAKAALESAQQETRRQQLVEEVKNLLKEVKNAD